MTRSAALVSWFVLSTLVTTPHAAVPGEHQPKPAFDARFPADPAARQRAVLRQPGPVQRAAAAELQAQRADLDLRWDGMSGAPRWLAARSGSALSAPGAGSFEDVARRFLRARFALVGLRPSELAGLEVTDVVPAPGGGARVHLLQRVGGVEVFGGRLMVTLNADRSVRTVGGALYAGVPAPGRPGIDAAEATRLAVRDVYPELAFGGAGATPGDPREQAVTFDEPGYGRPLRARLVLFPERDSARLAWEVRVAEASRYTDYTLLIDAATGELLFRRNETLYAEARVLLADRPQAEGEEVSATPYSVVTLPATTPESPQGWITAPGASLDGNNATSHLDHPSRPGLAEPDAVYDYPFHTQESSLVTAWYWVNDVHDRFYAAGFDEAAGNFQQDNFGLGGLGGDPMGVAAWSWGFRNNAFYSHDVDGAPASVNMLWMSCEFCGDHDGYPENGGDRPGGFDRAVVAHEYAHGVSTRMVGGPANGSCLLGTQSGAMGEGWSDIFPAAFYDLSQGGNYLLEGSGWVRGLEHDLRYEELCEGFGCAVHDDGMIWAGTLWDLRKSMIALDPATGADDFLRIAVQGMAETPCFPSMLDARDGILQADTLLYGSAHHQVIWNVFAARGMGAAASSTGENDPAPVTDHTVPAGMECTAPVVPGGLTATPEGANAVRLNYAATGASAVEVWRDDLDNTVDRSRRIGSTSDAATFLDATVEGSKTYRYHVVGLGPGGTVCRSAASATADATATGTCSAYPRFAPALSIADGSPDCSLTLSWAAAQEGCPGSGDPIVYNVYRAPSPGFEPSEKRMIGRTAATTFQDEPPEDGQTYYYLVLAQHGTLADPADHRDRGSAQVLRWVPRLALLNRTTAQFWDFETGPQGWTVDNSLDPAGAWTLTVPNGTRYEEAPYAPDEAAGGGGMAWVTGDAPVSQSMTEFDSEGFNTLTSPNWSTTGGATILSFDYWSHTPGGVINDGLEVMIRGLGLETIMPIRLMGTQRFDAPARYGWQRAEIDLAQHIGPSPQMQVIFRPSPAWLSEFGVDNVRVERGGTCARSSLTIQSVTVDDTPAGWGNGNGVLEPGETANLAITLTNGGGAVATAPAGHLTGGPAGLVVHTADATFPDILVGGSGTSLGSGFTVSLPHGLPCGDTVALQLEVVDAAGTVSRDGWFPETGGTATDVVFTDDFETDQGWLVDGALPGFGIWQRGDPVGTMDGLEQANPETDSPNDAGAQCFVTENGAPGGDPNLTDVDAVEPLLFSPLIDLGGYKRARASFDLWHYVNSSGGEDYAGWGASIDSGSPFARAAGFEFARTGGWVPRQLDLTSLVPMAPNVRLSFQSLDRDETFSPSWTDHVVETGVDNVRVEADRPVCAPSSVLQPNGVGATLMVARTSAVDLSWTASPVDATHDAAVYYRVYESGGPSAGFAVATSPMTTVASLPLAGSSSYYLVTAVNAGGTSGDEPAP